MPKNDNIQLAPEQAPKAEKVKFLTANCRCWEKKEGVLNAMGEDDLDAFYQDARLTVPALQIVANMEEDDEEDDNADEEDAEGEDKGKPFMKKTGNQRQAEEPTRNREAPAPKLTKEAVLEVIANMTFAEKLSIMPADFQAVANSMIKESNDRRKEYYDFLVANFRGSESDKESYRRFLSDKDLPTLKMIADPIIAANAQHQPDLQVNRPLYDGQQGGPVGNRVSLTGGGPNLVQGTFPSMFGNTGEPLLLPPVQPGAAQATGNQGQQGTANGAGGQVGNLSPIEFGTPVPRFEIDWEAELSKSRNGRG